MTYTWDQKVKVCLVGSDGFWDMISNQEAVEHLKNNSGGLMVMGWFGLI
jgi:serine/threonine protein phosphatase PrpC